MAERRRSFGQADGGDGLRRDPLTATGEAQLLRGCRLDADLIRPQARDLCDPGLDGRAMRANLRRFADDGAVKVIDASTLLRHKVARVTQEAIRRRTFP